MKALKIYFAAGTNGYDLVSATQAPLPATRVLRQRLEHIKFRPGILTEVFARQPAKAENMTEIEKECWLLSDEMYIGQATEFDSSVKHYVGNCTIPGSRPTLSKEEKAALGNDPKLILDERIRRSKTLLQTKATKAMIFLLCGFGWKLLVGYEFTGNSFCPFSVTRRIVDIVRLAHRCQLRVRGLITDMGYRCVWRCLNVDISATASQVTIPHPAIPTEELFVMPDPVHVFKSIVEMLGANKEIMLHENIVKEFNLPSRTVKLEHLEKLCSYQASMKWKLAPTLSESLLKLNHFEKNACSECQGRLQPPCGRGSRVPFENLWRKVNGDHCVLHRSGGAVARISHSKDSHARYREKKSTSLRGCPSHLAQREESLCDNDSGKPCQTGVKGITHVALKLIKFYLDVKEVPFLMLGDFTSDPAENFMSRIRILHPNPTALQFTRRAKKVTVSQYLSHVSKSSYEADNKAELLDLLRTHSEEDPDQAAQSTDLDEEEAVVMFSLQSQENHGCQMSEAEKPVFYRVCGYILKKLQEEKPSFGE